MAGEQVDIKVMVNVLSAHYRQPQTPSNVGSLDWSTKHASPFEEAPRPEIDPNYVNVNFTLLENKMLGDDTDGCVLIKTEQARALELMVGDVITLKLVKDSK